MPFISYAQNNEDVLLWRALGHVIPGEGFYIDVGANDPVEHSVTKAFYDAGWRGINIEPLPVHIEAFDAQRPRDRNLAIAAGSTEGSLTLYDVPAVRGWASPEPDVAAMHRAEGHTVAELTVPVRTLAAVCADYVDGPIHFLKIDVEGFEGEVLRGMDFARWRPWVLVIEATLPNSRVTNHATWEHLVTGQGYRFAWFDGLNRYYVAEEHPELLAHFGTQPNVFDDYISHHLDKAWQANREAGEALRRNQEDANRALRDAQAHTERALQDAQENTERALQAAQANSERALQAAQQEAERALGAAQENADRIARTLQDQVEARRRETEAVRDELRETLAHADTLERDKLAAQAEAARLSAELVQVHANAAAVTLWARELEQRLVATLASTSWKVTGPLRYVGAIVHKLRAPGVAQRVVKRATTKVTTNQRLRRVLIPIIVRHPALQRRVSATLQAIKQVPVAQPPLPADLVVPEEQRGLPASVRTVLADLQRVRKHAGN